MHSFCRSSSLQEHVFFLNIGCCFSPELLSFFLFYVFYKNQFFWFRSLDACISRQREIAIRNGQLKPNSENIASNSSISYVHCTGQISTFEENCVPPKSFAFSWQILVGFSRSKHWKGSHTWNFPYEDYLRKKRLQLLVCSKINAKTYHSFTLNFLLRLYKTISF